MSKIHSIVEYKKVTGFPDYRIGSDGSIWSCYRRGNGPHGWVAGEGWHQLRPRLSGKGVKGRLIIALRSLAGKEVTCKVHRLVLEAFVGPCPSGMEGCHEDGDRLNNAVGNLSWGTRKKNASDKRLHGTMYCGESHHLSKLTKEQVGEIFHKVRSGAMSRLEASRKFGISKTSVRKILCGQNWKHLGLTRETT